VKEPVSPAGRWSRGDFLKQLPAEEHYHDFFKAFVKANKIDLNQYDAVIGPLFQHGGNQMCVLNKTIDRNALQARMDAALRD
jgi:hypothetical protein